MNEQKRDSFKDRLGEELRKPIYKYAFGVALILVIIALSLKFGYLVGQWLYAMTH